MDINNEAQLKSVLLDITEIVISEVADQLYKKLMDNLGKYVYRSNNAQYAYGSGYSTGELAESWQVRTHKSGDQISSIINQDYSVMNSDPANFVHGSNYYSNSDAREWVAYYINEGTSGLIFGQGPWTKARPFWDETMKLLEDGTIDRWIRKSFKSYGITLK